MAAYYNEIEPYAAQWLRNLISAGLIPAGDVDERDIRDVRPGDLRGYTQCHFFAGIAGWGYALRLAGWEDERPVWTGSCPCQPFSVAGKGNAEKDSRHLWPELFRLIRKCRPATVFGEQVAAAVGKDWFDGVFSDLESADYACGAAIVPACAVGAPHRRDRLWFVADAHGARPQIMQSKRGNARAEFQTAIGNSGGGTVADTNGELHNRCRDQRTARWHESTDRSGDVANTNLDGREARSIATAPSRHRSASDSNGWADAGWIAGADGKARRVKSGLCLLAHGVPGRVGRLRAYGNAIVPQVAAEVISAYMEISNVTR